MSMLNHSQSITDNDASAETASFSAAASSRFDTEPASCSVNENGQSGRGLRRNNRTKKHKSGKQSNKEDNNNKKKRNRGRRSGQGQDKDNADGIGEPARKKLLEAFQNPVVFKDFSVVDNFHHLLDTRKPCPGVPPPCTQYWNGDEPKVAVDRDGIPILVYLPGLFSEKDNKFACDAMTRFHNNNKSSIQPKATGSNARNKISNFTQHANDSPVGCTPESPMIGVVELGIVVEQGHSHQQPRASLANFSNTVTGVSERSSLNTSFNFCRSAANAVLSFVDPEWFVALNTIRNCLHNSNSSNSLVQGNDDSLLPSHTVTWDRHIDTHRDTKDHPRGWASLSVYGTFKEGGDLCIPTLGLRMRFLPRDAAYIRGTMLEHRIMEFQGGHRFAHTSYFPFSMLQHYQHLLHKPLLSMSFSSVEEIRTSLALSHRKQRCMLGGKSTQNREASSHIPRVEMRMQQNKNTFNERQRRIDLRGGKGKKNNVDQ